jgi:hypothetical protein
VDSSRSSVLLQIIQIENKVKQIINSKKYKKIRRNVAILKNQAGRSMMELDDLDNNDRKIQVRRNSKVAKEYLIRYQSMLDNFESQISQLGSKRMSLNKELFG